MKFTAKVIQQVAHPRGGNVPSEANIEIINVPHYDAAEQLLRSELKGLCEIISIKPILKLI